MMKQIISGIFAFFMVAMLSSNASAVATFAEMANGASSMTITEGDDVYFDVGIFSVNAPMNYDLKMYQNGNLVSIFKDNVEDADGWYSERIYISEDDYGQVGGAFSIIISSEDAESSDYYTLTLNVVGVNDAPSIAVPDMTIVEEVPYTIDLDDYSTDVDNADSELSFLMYGSSVNIDIDAVNHIATFTAPSGSAGNIEFTVVQVCDSEWACSSSYFWITIEPSSVPSIELIHAPSSVKEGQTLSISCDLFDGNGDLLTYAIYKNGVLVSTTNSYIWETDENDAGVYTFQFDITDTGDNSVYTYSMTITITNVASLGKPSLNVELQPFYVFGDAYLKIRNKGMAVEDLEITASIPEIGYEETITVNIERNEIKQIVLNVPQDNAGTYIMEVQLDADDYSALRYAVVEI